MSLAKLISHITYYLVGQYTHLDAHNLYGIILLHSLLLFAYKNWFIIICILWSWLIVESDLCERMDRKRHQWPEGLERSGQSDN